MRIARYFPTKTLLVEQIKKTGNRKYGGYWTLSHTWLEWTVAAKLLEKLYADKLQVPKAARRSLITGDDRPSQKGQKDFKHSSKK